MSVSAVVLVDAAYATNADVIVYTVPVGRTVIIDKFTAQNSDTGSQTLNINIIPASGSVGGSNLIMNAASMATTVTRDFSELQNQILKSGDQISIKGSVASKIVVRICGRSIA